MKVGLITEILVHIVLLVGAALLLGGFLLLKVLERELLDQRLVGIEATMVAISRSLSYGDDQKSPPAGEMAERTRLLLESLPAEVAPANWALVGSDLQTVTRTMEPEMTQLRLARAGEGAALQLDYPPLGLFAARAPGAAVLVSVPITAAGRFLGVLQARYPLDDLRRRIATGRRLVLLYALLYGSVLTAAGVFLLYRNIVRPVRELMQATRQVAAGDLEQLLPEEGPKEIADLSRSFNAMTGALHASRRQTEEHIRSLREANEALASTRDEVVRSARMASVGHLAAGMAHEIGNPLGALVGYLGLLRAELPAGREQEIASRALAEADRIDLLVRDLLDYAAPGRDQAEPLDPAGSLRQAVGILEHQGAFARVPVRDRLPPALPCVHLPAHKLQQVFVNLLLNARDACGEAAPITLSGGCEGEEVRISVQDAGEGISPSILPHIFDPFFTTKDPGKGRGLGLAVCQRIIDEAGGRLEVESAAGRGTTFTVRLKQAEAP